METNNQIQPTNENQPQNNEKKSNTVIAGAAAAAGIVAGAVGAYAASHLNSPTPTPVIDDTTEELVAEQEPSVVHHYHHDVKPEPDLTINVEVDREIIIRDVPVNDDIEVLRYERVDTPDGQMDIVTTQYKGETVYVVDADLDTRADYLIHDQDHDGVFQDNEVTDIRDQNASMDVLRAEANVVVMPEDNFIPEPDFDVADNNDFNDFGAGDPDYINDANVGDFMA